MTLSDKVIVIIIIISKRCRQSLAQNCYRQLSERAMRTWLDLAGDVGLSLAFWCSVFLLDVEFVSILEELSIMTKQDFRQAATHKLCCHEIHFKLSKSKVFKIFSLTKLSDKFGHSVLFAILCRIANSAIKGQVLRTAPFGERAYLACENMEARQFIFHKRVLCAVLC